MAKRKLINPLRSPTIFLGIVNIEGNAVLEKIAEVLFIIEYILIKDQK
jgi:hypothetical protein